MIALLAEAEMLLRAEGRHAVGRSGAVPLRPLALLVAVSGALFGAAMGSFALRAPQIAYSAAKVPLLLAVTSLVCLPSFFVLNSLLGLRDDFDRALRAVFASQATVAVALASLAPLTLVAYASSDNYRFAVLFDGAVFLVATLLGQRMLNRHYRELVRQNPRHRTARRAWLALYVFVAIQLAWVLRPFVGDPGMAPRFFREGARDDWSNAYVVIFRDVLGLDWF